jgi:hypothetical protein
MKMKIKKIIEIKTFTVIIIVDLAKKLRFQNFS